MLHSKSSSSPNNECPARVTTAHGGMVPFIQHPLFSIPHLPLDLHRADEFLYMIDAALEHLSFIVVEFDFDDPLDAFGAQDAGNAHEIASDSVFLLTEDGTGQDSLLVLDDRLGHLHGRRGGCVIGAAGLEQPDDFRSATAGA